MRAIAIIICLCCVVLFFNACSAVQYAPTNKYTIQHIQEPAISNACKDVACALINYTEQKNYAIRLKTALDSAVNYE